MSAVLAHDPGPLLLFPPHLYSTVSGAGPPELYSTVSGATPSELYSTVSGAGPTELYSTVSGAGHSELYLPHLYGEDTDGEDTAQITPLFVSLICFLP